MTDYLFFILLGTGAGAIIAAFGLGLVVTYQGSGLVNFAYGAMATWSGYVYAELRQGAYPFPVPGLPDRYHFGDDVGIWWAFLLALLTAALMGLVVYQLVFKPLYRAPALANIVASVGLVIVITSLIERRFADNAGLRVDPILPREPVTIMDGVTVPRDGLWLVLIVLLMATAVWVVVAIHPARPGHQGGGRKREGSDPARLLAATVGAGQFRAGIAHRWSRGDPGVTDDPAVVRGVHVRLSHPGPRRSAHRRIPKGLADRAHRSCDRPRAVELHQDADGFQLVPAVRGPRGSAVPRDHHRDGRARRATARPRVGRQFQDACDPGRQGHGA